MAQIGAEVAAGSQAKDIPSAAAMRDYYSAGPLTKEEIQERAPALRPPKAPEMSYKMVREARKK